MLQLSQTLFRERLFELNPAGIVIAPHDRGEGILRTHRHQHFAAAFGRSRPCSIAPDGERSATTTDRERSIDIAEAAKMTGWRTRRRRPLKPSTLRPNCSIAETPDCHAGKFCRPARAAQMRTLTLHQSGTSWSSSRAASDHSHQHEEDEGRQPRRGLIRVTPRLLSPCA